MSLIKDYLTIFKEILTPNEICDSVQDISLESLKDQGFQTILLDVDNTLMTYDQREVGLQTVQWIEQMKSLDFQIFLVSNNLSRRRILRVCKQLNVKGIYFACKPFTFAVTDLAKKYKFDFESSVIIGDQLLKDVFVGNWLRMHSILVNPIDIKKSLLKTSQRDFELFLLRKLANHKELKSRYN